MIAAIISHWRVIAAAAITVAAAYAGWYLNGLRWETRQAALVREYDSAAQQAREAAQVKQDAMADAYSRADSERWEQLQDAENEIATLRTAVAGGTKRVYIRAECTSRANVPAGSKPASMGKTAAAELAGDIRESYFRLREQLETMQAQLEWYQDAFKALESQN